MRGVAQGMRRVAQEMRNEPWDPGMSENLSSAPWTVAIDRSGGGRLERRP